jgi:hypothetical protein
VRVDQTRLVKSLIRQDRRQKGNGSPESMLEDVENDLRVLKEKIWGGKVSNREDWDLS